jgi:2-phospho-L-lactate/phosphoenolpyruvate guanylyltransferase
MHILIPAKPSWLAKRRLAPILSGSERTAFTRWLVSQLLATIHASDLDARPVLLTGDPALAALAEPYGYPTLPDPPDSDLNDALEQGRVYAMAQGATSLLVLPTDLPYLTPDALHTFIQQTTGNNPLVSIAPDREGVGTNALFLRPADAIPYRFGIGSAALHRAEAQKNGIPFMEYRDPAFAQDIDTPEHYRAMEGELYEVKG